MEHFYNKIDSENWFDYSNLYENIVKIFPTNSHFVEVGVWKGMSAVFMAVEIINSNKNIKFDCVDTWEYVETSSEIKPEQFTKLFDIFLKNVEPVKDKINIVKSISWEGAKLYEDNSLDFIWIDAGHDYESSFKDISSWYPKLKEDGIIGGHDYHFNVGAFKSVNEIFGKNNIKQIGSSWLYDRNNRFK